MYRFTLQLGNMQACPRVACMQLGNIHKIFKKTNTQKIYNTPCRYVYNFLLKSIRCLCRFVCINVWNVLIQQFWSKIQVPGTYVRFFVVLRLPSAKRGEVANPPGSQPSVVAHRICRICIHFGSSSWLGNSRFPKGDDTESSIHNILLALVRCFGAWLLRNGGTLQLALQMFHRWPSPSGFCGCCRK
jgi:hypothetical protein